MDIRTRLLVNEHQPGEGKFLSPSPSLHDPNTNSTMQLQNVSLHTACDGASVITCHMWPLERELIKYGVFMPRGFVAHS